MSVCVCVVGGVGEGALGLCCNGEHMIIFFTPLS